MARFSNKEPNNKGDSLKVLISPFILMFGIFLALLLITWTSDENVFQIFWGYGLDDPSALISVILTLTPTGITAPLLMFAGIFQAPARLPNNNRRTLFAIFSISVSMIVFTMLIKNILNLEHLRDYESCLRGLRSATSCDSQAGIPKAYFTEIRIYAVGIFGCLVIQSFFQAACVAIHIAEQTGRTLERFNEHL